MYKWVIWLSQIPSLKLISELNKNGFLIEKLISSTPSPHFARPCPPGLAPFLACLLGKDEEPRQTPLPVSVSIPREHILRKKTQKKKQTRRALGFFFFFFAFKPNTLIFAFQAEGRLQPFFPALLLREWGTNPDASS